MNPKRFRFACTAVVILLALPALAERLSLSRPGSVGMSAERLEVLRDYFRGQVDSGLEPGMQVLVARHGKVVLHENFGYRNVETQEPLTFDTLFRIMSLTKPVTNAAAMILYEEGRFAMDDPLAKFIPAFADLEVFAGLDANGALTVEPARHPPTMHELMTHTAGFTYGGGYNESPVNALYRELKPFAADATRQQTIERLARIPLAYQPGTEYMYSYSADILGFIVEIIAGQDLGSFLDDRLFGPLGMKGTYAWVPPAAAARLMPIHGYAEDGSLTLLPNDWNPARPFDHAVVEPVTFGGGFQLVSSPGDYFRFAQMLLDGGEFDGKRILAPSTVRFMTSQRYPQAVRDRYWAPGQGHGLNVSVVTDPSLVNYPTHAGEFSHGGVANGYFFVDPAAGLVVIMQGQLIPPRYRKEHIPVVNALVHAAIIE